MKICPDLLNGEERRAESGGQEERGAEQRADSGGQEEEGGEQGAEGRLRLRLRLR